MTEFMSSMESYEAMLRSERDLVVEQRTPDLDGRPFGHPDWVDPRPEAERRGLYYCCGLLGWVTAPEVFDHRWETPGWEDNEHR